MALTTEGNGAEDASGPGTDQDNARDRLAALKARRQSLGQTAPEMDFGANPAAQPTSVARLSAPSLFAPPAAGRAPAGGALNTDKMKAIRAKILPRIYLLLTQTPVDHRGMVGQTDYSHAGFAKFIDLLRGQAQHPTDPRIARIAGGLLKFLTAVPGEAATPQGISVAKLILLAQKGEALKGPNAGKVKPAAAMAAPARGLFAAGSGKAGGRGAAQTRRAPFGQRPGGGMGGPAVSREILAKLGFMLKNTPAGTEGLVEGTAFSKAGVARLMTMLTDKAQGPRTAATEMADRILQMIRAEPGDGSAVHGASAEKLQKIASRLTGQG